MLDSTFGGLYAFEITTYQASGLIVGVKFYFTSKDTATTFVAVAKSSNLVVRGQAATITAALYEGQPELLSAAHAASVSIAALAATLMLVL